MTTETYYENRLTLTSPKVPPSKAAHPRRMAILSPEDTFPLNPLRIALNTSFIRSCPFFDTASFSPAGSSQSKTPKSLAAFTAVANSSVPVGKSQYNTQSALFTRLRSNAHSMIWSAAFGGIPTPFVATREFGCACALRYLIICSAATPVNKT